MFRETGYAASHMNRRLTRCFFYSCHHKKTKCHCLFQPYNMFFTTLFSQFLFSTSWYVYLLIIYYALLSQFMMLFFTSSLFPKTKLNSLNCKQCTLSLSGHVKDIEFIEYTKRANCLQIIILKHLLKKGLIPVGCCSHTCGTLPNNLVFKKNYICT